ncbi:MAG: prolipoprotein diacylglyceryl transferase [Candidatus Moraniibacteriota bacterium]
MPEWYQNLPSLVHQPVAVQIGEWSVKWYALAYLLALGISVWIIRKIVQSERRYSLSPEQWLDLLLFVLAGILIGGRLGFVFLYDPAYFWVHPWQIVVPFDMTTGVWTGVAGMSFHGGLIGAGVGLWLVTRKYQWDWWYWADIVAFVAPIGSFLGRIANFVNGELYGRVTASGMGMYFPLDGFNGQSLRYPSQLYEAFGEGVVLFFVMWWLRTRFALGSGKVVAGYLIGYGAIRFIIEFFREPDPSLGLVVFNFFSLGQVLCLGMVIVGIDLWRHREKSVILKQTDNS